MVHVIWRHCFRGSFGKWNKRSQFLESSQVRDFGYRETHSMQRKYYEIWKGIAILFLFGIVVCIEANTIGLQRNIGIYDLDLIQYNRYYKIAAFCICIILQYFLIIYLVKIKKTLFSKEYDLSLKQCVAIPVFLAIQGLNAYLLYFSCIYLIVSLVLPFGFRYCDTIQSGQKVYHLDLFKGFDRNYRLIQCNSWKLCKTLYRSRDESSRQNEKLMIDNKGFLFATSANSSKLIVWDQYDENGRFVGVIDRIPIK